MPSKKADVQKQIMHTIFQSSQPATLAEVVKQVDGDNETVRRAIRSLVDRGELKVTLDWKLRAAKK